MHTSPTSPAAVKASSPRKPRPRPIRRARLCGPADGVQVLTLTITTPRVKGPAKVEVFNYFLEALLSDFGRGYRLHRFADQVKADEPSHYDVHLDPAGGHSCECKAHLRYGLACGDVEGPFPGCKHLAACLALTASGKLPPVLMVPAAAVA